MLGYYTAIAFDGSGKAYKYRNIKTNNVFKFQEFCKTKNIKYINYYCKKTKSFVSREYLNPARIGFR